MSNYKSFISILGTNDYLECRHSFNNKIGQKVVKYVQEDLIKFFCKDFDENSEIRIFLTNDARKKNWDDNGHGVENIGLKKRLEHLSLKAKIKDYSIPSGNNEDEIWQTFQLIYDTFYNKEVVIVDITHSFRSLPMLLTILLSFTKQIKNIQVAGIYYSAFESLGPLAEVRKMPPENRIAPIIDLTSFSKLQDWTLSTFDYVTNANTKMLNKLVRDELFDKDLSESDKALKRIIKDLDNLTNSIALCRGKDLLEIDFNNIKIQLENLKQSFLVPKPLNVLIDHIISKIYRFSTKDFNNLLAAVEWCFEHKLYQQAITLLQETIITIILKETGFDPHNKSLRTVASNSIRIKSESISEDNWSNVNKNNKEATNKILSLELVEEIKSEYEKLTDIRNDVNHGGFLSDAKNIDSIKSRLQNSIDNIIPILKKHLIF